MPWVRFDDQYLQSKPLRAAGRDAVWLHFTAVFWSARIDNLFDGRIEKQGQPLEDFAAHAMLKAGQVRKLAAVLVANGRWEDHGDYWLIHDYHDYQPTRAQVEAMREKRSAAGKRGADARHGKSHSKSLGKPDSTCLDEPLAPRPETRLGSVEDDRQTHTAEQVVVAASKLEAKRKGHGPNYAFGVAKNLREERFDEIEALVAGQPSASLDDLARWALDGLPKLAIVKRELPPEIQATLEAEERKALA